MGQDETIADVEERTLVFLVEAKKKTIQALQLLVECHARKGATVLGVGDSAEMELLMLLGYERALRNRRAELRELAKEGVV